MKDYGSTVADSTDNNELIPQANVANTQGTAFLKPNYLRNVNYANGNEDVETYPGLNP
jgi:hypothetical protein